MGPYYRDSSQDIVRLIYSGELLAWVGGAIAVYLAYRLFMRYRRQKKSDPKRK